MGSNPSSGTMKRYGPYESNHGHLFWVDLLDDGSRKSIWLHRELMEQHLGRTLSDEEVVHHRNENKKDNRIENLEVKLHSDHTRDHQAPAEVVEIKCLECGELAFRLARHIRHNQGTQKKPGPFCGRRCAGRANARQRTY